MSAGTAFAVTLINTFLYNFFKDYGNGAISMLGLSIAVQVSMPLITSGMFTVFSTKNLWYNYDSTGSLAL